MIKKILLILILCISPCYARDYKDLTVTLVRVYDGDTIIVKVDNVPDVFEEISVRIHGVDCPEIRSKNVKIRELAIQARTFTQEQLVNKKIVLKNIRRDKYFRLLADIDGKDGSLSQSLIQSGLGVPYFGGKKTKWK